MNRHAFLPPPAVEAGESPQRHGQTPVLGAGLVDAAAHVAVARTPRQQLTTFCELSEIFREPSPGGPSLRLDEPLPMLLPLPPSTALGSPLRLRLWADFAPGCYLPELASPCFRNSPAGQGSVSPAAGITLMLTEQLGSRRQVGCAVE